MRSAEHYAGAIGSRNWPRKTDPFRDFAYPRPAWVDHASYDPHTKTFYAEPYNRPQDDDPHIAALRTMGYDVEILDPSYSVWNRGACWVVTIRRTRQPWC